MRFASGATSFGGNVGALGGEVVFVASKFPDDGAVAALERSIANATHLRARDSAAIAAARVLARRIDILDENGGLDDNGKLDNVSVPTFLKYLQALNLLPEPAAVQTAKSAPAPPVSELDRFRAKHKAG